MEHWKVNDGNRLMVIQASSEAEACAIAMVEPMKSKRHPSVTVEKCGPAAIVVKGSMKNCCQDPVNLDWVNCGDNEMGLCKVCGCRHFRTRCDPGRIGVDSPGRQ